MNRFILQQCNRYRTLVIFLGTISLVLGLATFSLRAEDNNVHMYGAIVAEPCIISPGNDEIHLDFSNVVGKYLYLNTRTIGQQFEIRLAECDLSLGKSVKVTFSGNESIALPGLLAIETSSEASGIAVGFETLNGKKMLINKKSDEFLLQKGSSIIALKTYIRGEPQAIENNTIGYGTFNAVATFSLEYE